MPAYVGQSTLYLALSLTFHAQLMTSHPPPCSFSPHHFVGRLSCCRPLSPLRTFDSHFSSTSGLSVFVCALESHHMSINTAVGAPGQIVSGTRRAVRPGSCPCADCINGLPPRPAIGNMSDAYVIALHHAYLARENCTEATPGKHQSPSTSSTNASEAASATSQRPSSNDDSDLGPPSKRLRASIG